MTDKNDPLKEGIDYIIDTNGRWVFTEKFLLQRGHCCVLVRTAHTTTPAKLIQIYRQNCKSLGKTKLLKSMMVLLMKNNF